jgi:hypothetical protein
MNWIDWKDQIDEFDGCFVETPQADGSIKHTPVRGTVQQEGTSQDEANFGAMMDGIIEAHLVLGLLINYARQNGWEIERGTVNLTNSQNYPFNNSAKSVALSAVKENTDYIVLAEVTSFSGNVGEIEITDKLQNGFKIGYTGSAASATVNYAVIGGFLK